MTPLSLSNPFRYVAEKTFWTPKTEKTNISQLLLLRKALELDVGHESVENSEVIFKYVFHFHFHFVFILFLSLSLSLSLYLSISLSIYLMLTIIGYQFRFPPRSGASQSRSRVTIRPSRTRIYRNNRHQTPGNCVGFALQ